MTHSGKNRSFSLLLQFVLVCFYSSIVPYVNLPSLARRMDHVSYYSTLLLDDQRLLCFWLTCASRCESSRPTAIVDDDITPLCMLHVCASQALNYKVKWWTLTGRQLICCEIWNKITCIYGEAVVGWIIRVPVVHAKRRSRPLTACAPVRCPASLQLANNKNIPA